VVNLRRVINFGNESYMGIVELFEQMTIPEKSLHKVNNVLVDNFPIGFVKKPCEPIGTRGLSQTKLRNGQGDFNKGKG
jgi:hypothetical protein